MPSRRLIRVRGVGRYVTPLGEEFVSVEALGGIVLVAASIAALLWANLGGDGYARVWDHVVTLGPARWDLSLDLRHWINDGFMTVFFFVVGLEIKRELVVGDLRDRRTALVPVCAAIGGMALPALIFLACNLGTSATRGWGIPMATDIALTMAVLAILGTTVPGSLRLFLLTLAIVDDIGAILVIAVFYSSGVDGAWLGGGVLVVGLVVALRAANVRMPIVYVVPAFALWYCVFRSGVHATIAGVVLGLLMPAHAVRGRNVLEHLEGRLHPVSSFVIVPIFALANAGVVLRGDAIADAASSRVAWGIVAGLLVGKTIGITGATCARDAIRPRASAGRVADEARRGRGRARGNRLHGVVVRRRSLVCRRATRRRQGRGARRVGGRGGDGGARAPAFGARPARATGAGSLTGPAGGSGSGTERGVERRCGSPGELQRAQDWPTSCRHQPLRCWDRTGRDPSARAPS